jgi:phospholipid N-methyltransferase
MSIGSTMSALRATRTAPSRVPFLPEFLRAPRRTGSVAASSRALARQMVAAIPDVPQPVVVELGPGTGAFTGAIAQRLGGQGHQLAVEVNPRFAAALRQRFPALDVAACDALLLPRLLHERGRAAADVVLSGLPWSSFTRERQRSLLGVVAGCVAPGGAFVTFAYVHSPWYPPARRFRALLEAAFEEVTVSPTVWRNLPPAFVYAARRAGAS